MPSKSYPRGILRAAPAFYVPLTLASILMPPRQNSKSEARNPKQYQMSQIENSKRAGLQAVRFRDLEIRILNLFRISKFELRISKGDRRSTRRCTPIFFFYLRASAVLSRAEVR